MVDAVMNMNGIKQSGRSSGIIIIIIIITIRQETSSQ